MLFTLFICSVLCLIFRLLTLLLLQLDESLRHHSVIKLTPETKSMVRTERGHTIAQAALTAALLTGAV